VKRQRVHRYRGSIVHLAHYQMLFLRHAVKFMPSAVVHNTLKRAFYAESCMAVRRQPEQGRIVGYTEDFMCSVKSLYFQSV